MSHVKDLTGQKFGRLQVIKRDTRPNKKGCAKWYCQCECGAIISVIGYDLIRGHTNSCGCYHKEQASKFLTMLKSKK